MMALSLALLCLFTVGAGAAAAKLTPPRLALFELPTISGHGVARSGKVLHASSTASSAGVATAAGVTARVNGLLKSGALGTRVGAFVTNLSTGQALYERSDTAGFTPASTTKIATAVGALQKP